MPDPTADDVASDPTQPAAEQPEAEAAPTVQRNMHDALLGLKQLFSQLDVPESFQIRDIAGTVHQLRAVLPAKAQIRIVRLLQDLASDGSVDMTPFFGTLKTDPRGALAVAINLALDERVLRVLTSAFELAHAPALLRAREAAGQPTGGVDDLFPLEEVVRATIPLFVLPVLRLLDLAIGFVSPTTN